MLEIYCNTPKDSKKIIHLIKNQNVFSKDLKGGLSFLSNDSLN